MLSTKALIGIAVGVVLAIGLMIVLFSAFRSGFRSRYARKVTEDEKEVIRRLVEEAAPQLEGKQFKRADIVELLDLPSLDPVIYVHFQALMQRGELTEENLLKSLG